MVIIIEARERNSRKEKAVGAKILLMEIALSRQSHPVVEKKWRGVREKEKARAVKEKARLAGGKALAARDGGRNKRTVT